MLIRSRFQIAVAATMLLALSAPCSELLAQRGGQRGGQQGGGQQAGGQQAGGQQAGGQQGGWQQGRGQQDGQNRQFGRQGGGQQFGGRGQGDAQRGDFQRGGRPQRGEADAGRGDDGGRGRGDDGGRGRGDDRGRGAERGGNDRAGRDSESRDRSDDNIDRRDRRRPRVERVDLRDQVNNQLKALDLNRNGQLDPSEANPTSLAIMKQVGLDPGFPVSLDTLVMLSNQLDHEQIEFPLETGVFVRERTRLEFQAPRSRDRVAGFSDATHPLMSDPTPMEERYSPSVLFEVRSLIQRYDENGNGVLDPAEIARVPWSAPHPNESDLDQNGVLSQIELAERLSQFTADGSSPQPRRTRGRTRNPNDGQQDENRAAAEQERQQRAAERAARERSRRQDPRTDRVDTYVKDLINKLDKDRDGMVSAEELEEMRNKPPKSADKNEDGQLSYAELYAYYSDGESPSSSSESSSSSSSQSPLADAIRWDGAFPNDYSEGTEWPANLVSKDRNGDGMISLAEFNGYGNTITDATRESFGRLDLNGDGFITLAEANSSGSRQANSAKSSTATSSRDTGRAGRGRGFGGRTNSGNASQRESGQQESTPPPAGAVLPNTIRYNFGG